MRMTPMFIDEIRVGQIFYHLNDKCIKTDRRINDAYGVIMIDTEHEFYLFKHTIVYV